MTVSPPSGVTTETPTAWASRTRTGVLASASRSYAPVLRTSHWSGYAWSPSEEKSDAARTRNLCHAVEPAARVSVTEVPQVTPSRDSSSARERLADVGSTAGATTV